MLNFCENFLGVVCNPHANRHTDEKFGKNHTQNAKKNNNKQLQLRWQSELVMIKTHEILAEDTTGKKLLCTGEKYFRFRSTNAGQPEKTLDGLFLRIKSGRRVGKTTGRGDGIYTWDGTTVSGGWRNSTTEEGASRQRATCVTSGRVTTSDRGHLLMTSQSKHRSATAAARKTPRG